MNQSIGQKFPNLSMLDHLGKEIPLSELTLGKFPLFVVFYRGYW